MDNLSYLHGGNIHEIVRDKKIKVIDFSANINPLGIPEKIKRDLFKVFHQVEHYPDIESFELRRQIANYWDINHENILVTNGSVEGLYLLMQMYRPKNVCIPVPSFTEYERAARLIKSTVQKFCLRERDGFIPDLDVFKKADMLVIGNPNNPTGNYLRDKTNLLENLPFKNIIIDEAFMDFEEKALQPSLIQIACKTDKITVLRTFTKFFCLPGLRVGYLVSHKKNIKRLQQKQLPWSVNYLAQTAARMILNDNGFIKKSIKTINEERKYLAGQLQSINSIKVFPSVTNFLLIKILNKNITSKILRNALLNKGIIIRDCSNFRGLNNQYVRIAVRNRKENSKLVQEIKEVMSKSE
ncbi:MAG: aminotransferase class I/II-fold pyridoxal phosphate-dependent enzyme [Candidatus Omnitrophica bacterium]|nr:aminotransferase class I/II-fold pyridoxal phosphate-dependent enzyme [Candidatus Omnitrophota bacterium]